MFATFLHRLGYRLGGRAPAAMQARGPSAAAMIIIISLGYFPQEAIFLRRLLFLRKCPEATLSKIPFSLYLIDQGYIFYMGSPAQGGGGKK